MTPMTSYSKACLIERSAAVMTSSRFWKRFPSVCILKLCNRWESRAEVSRADTDDEETFGSLQAMNSSIFVKCSVVVENKDTAMPKALFFLPKNWTQVFLKKIPMVGAVNCGVGGHRMNENDSFGSLHSTISSALCLTRPLSKLPWTRA